jgi:peptide deformylase
MQVTYLSPVSRDELAAVAEELDMVAMNHPVLWQPARPLAPETFGSPELARVVAGMWRTLNQSDDGVGLAATQVGLPFQIFLVDSGDGDHFSLCNPSYLGLPSPETLDGVEGCLSIPGFWAHVRRPQRRTVQGLDPAGAVQTIEGEGFLARILCHENDHLRGRLYVSAMDPQTFGADVEYAQHNPLYRPFVQPPIRNPR